MSFKAIKKEYGLSANDCYIIAMAHDVYRRPGWISIESYRIKEEDAVRYVACGAFKSYEIDTDDGYYLLEKAMPFSHHLFVAISQALVKDIKPDSCVGIQYEDCVLGLDD